MKTNLLTKSRKLPAVLALTAAALLALNPAGARAAAFTAGNLVIYRTGDGVATPTNTGNAVFLDEYTTAGAPVQSVALPTSASGVQFPLIASGVATSEGLLTRSANGQYLVLTGYGTTNGGTASLAGTTALAVPRVIGRVDGLGNIDTSTALTNVMSTGNPRSATSDDGTRFWIAGQGTTGNGGVRYVSVVGTNFGSEVENAFLNVRQINIFGGQLYLSSGATTPSRGMNTVGTGLPITSGQTVALLPGFVDNVTTPSPYGYCFADLSTGVAGVDTLYVTDDSRGILKFSLVAGSWVANGTNGTGSDAYRSVAAIVTGTNVTLYATRKGGSGATGGGELVTFTDTNGYNGTFSAVFAPVTVLATAVTKTAFRGVALAPDSGTTPTAPPAVITNPASGQVAIKFYGWSNTAYVVQTTTNIVGTWVPFSTNEAQPVGTWNNGSWTVTDPNATNAQQFYRLIIKP